jgi:hypothetical protein
MLALTINSERGSTQSMSGEVSVTEIFAQLEKEANADGAGNGGTGAAFRPNIGKRKPAHPRLDIVSLRKLLEYLRLSESGAVRKVGGRKRRLALVCLVACVLVCCLCSCLFACLLVFLFYLFAVCVVDCLFAVCVVERSSRLSLPHCLVRLTLCFILCSSVRRWSGPRQK